MYTATAHSDLARISSREQEQASTIHGLELALLDRQNSKSALQLELQHFQAEVETQRERERCCEREMLAVLDDLHKATFRTSVLEQVKREQEIEIAKLGSQIKVISNNAKKVFSFFLVCVHSHVRRCEGKGILTNPSLLGSEHVAPASLVFGIRVCFLGSCARNV
jgi:hypothetical protein